VRRALPQPFGRQRRRRTVSTGRTAGALLLAAREALELPDHVVMVLASIVTAPLRASAWPLIVAPVVRVIDARARMLPTKVVLVPRVAELPTCQITLRAVAPLVRSTLLADAVVRGRSVRVCPVFVRC
jgi:hypothetical protein